MKTELSNNPGATLEIAKCIIYSVKVLVIGLFIPFSFVFGITYKMHENIASKSSNISKPQVESANINTVTLIKILPVKTVNYKSIIKI